MMNKKAQGFSIEVIVIAVLALIVLVVLLVIFSGQASIFTKTIEDCQSRNGTPVQIKEDCVNAGGIIVFTMTENNIKKFCCVYGE